MNELPPNHFSASKHEFNKAKSPLYIVITESGSKHLIKQMRGSLTESDYLITSDGIKVSQPFVRDIIKCKNLKEVQKELFS